MDLQGREKTTIFLKNCEGGLGIKICGGQSNSSRYFGIFVKKILAGGVADKDGNLQEGDLLLEVNGRGLESASNREAVKIVRSAAQTGVARINIVRGPEIRKRFEEFCDSSNLSTLDSFTNDLDKVGLSRTSSYSSIGSGHSTEKRSWVYNGKSISPSLSGENRGLLGHGALPSSRFKPNEASGKCSPSLSTVDSGLPSSSSYPSPVNSDLGQYDREHIQHITINLETGLGISIERADNPQFVRVAAVATMGAASKDGRLQVGDILLSINGDSLVGVSFEQARATITRLKLKKTLQQCEIAFMRNPTRSSSMIHTRQQLHNGNLNHNHTQDSNNTSNLSQVQDIMLDDNNNNEEPLLDTSFHDSDAMTRKLQLLIHKSQTEGSSGFAHNDDYIYVPQNILPSYDDMPLPQRHINGLTSDSDVDHHSTPRRSFYPAVMSTPDDNYLARNQPTRERHGQARSIASYLQQDFNRLTQSLPLLSNDGSPRVSRKTNRSRRLSLDTETRLKLEKLEGAMHYLGYTLSELERAQIRASLQVDSSGMVTYGDFVRAARAVMNISLNGHLPELSPGSLGFAIRDVQSERSSGLQRTAVEPGTQPDVPSPLKIQPQLEGHRLIHSTQEDMDQRRYDLHRVRRERDDALRELARLKRSVREKDQDCVSLESELEKTRQDVAAAYRESGELRTRIQLTSEAQRAARHTEADYEEMIRQLEKELSLSRRNNPSSEEANELQKRLVVLGCQLRKAEVGRKTYQVAVERLTKFAQHVHDKLSDETKSSSSSTSRAPRVAGTELAKSAKETVKAVKIILEEDALPFGWEEVYTPDGSRYYINHVTQTTSWLHPLSGVQKLSNGNDGKSQSRSGKRR